MTFLQQFKNNYLSKLETYQDTATNFTEIKKKIFDKYQINLDTYQLEHVVRNTEAGFKMGYHRDNYMIRKFSGKYVFIPFENSKLPIYTLLWYRNNDFTGGSLEFLGGKTYQPSRDMFLFFDSNMIHRVNQQLSGTRITEIYKFY